MDEIFINKYKEDLMNKKLSKSTYEAYNRDLDKFYKYIKLNNKNLISVDTNFIKGYTQELAEENMAEASIVRNVISIRNLFKYLAKNDFITKNTVVEYEIPKFKKAIPQILSIEEVDRLLSSPNLNNIKGIRDKAMLETMYACGLKITELINLKIQDVNTYLKYIRCRGVNNKERIVPLGSIALNAIEAYNEKRQEINVNCLDYLFLNLKGKSMSRQGFWKLIKYYAEESKILKEVNSYTLRHSFAVHLIQNGADLKSVQELLGHVDMATTQIYLNLAKKNKIAEVYNKAHPRA